MEECLVLLLSLAAQKHLRSVLHSLQVIPLVIQNLTLHYQAAARAQAKPSAVGVAQDRIPPASALFFFYTGRGAFFSFRQGEKKRMGGALRGSCPLCNNIKEARANVRLCRNCLKKREARRTFLQIIDIPHKERYNFSCKNQKHFIDRMLLKTGRLCRRFQ